MTAPSGALVVFGITGDLASKQIFPALQAMVKHGHLDVPIVGVALGGSLDQLRVRARDSLDQHGGVDEKTFAQLSASLRYVDGDYQDQRSTACGRPWATRRDPCIISPFHLRCSQPWRPACRGRAVRKTRG